MPVSRIRKKRRSYKRTTKSKKKDVILDNGNLRITRKKFDVIKANPDFIAAVKVGRIVNALSFSIDNQIASLEAGNSPKAIRNRVRSIMSGAGYIQETLNVFHQLAKDYDRFPFFSKAKALLDTKERPNPSEKMNKRLKLMRIIRNVGGFHFDHENKSTADAMLNLDAEEYPIFSSDSDYAVDFYFDFSDIVDLNFYIDGMGGETTEEARHAEIYVAITELTKETFRAAHELLRGLIDRLGFPSDV